MSEMRQPRRAWRGRQFAGAGLLMLATLAFAGEPTGFPPAQSQDASLEVLDEVLVTGRQPGPALWRVRSGSNVLWILTEIRFVPSKLQWRSKQVEKVLDDAREVLVVAGGEPPAVTPEEKAAQLQRENNLKAVYARRFLPDGQTLRDVLSPEDYARYMAAVAAYAVDKKDAERLNPPRATSRLNYGLQRTLKLQVSPVTQKVVDAARRKRIKVTSVHPLYWKGPADLGEVDFMNTCGLLSTLDDLDHDAARMKTRINAWSVGDVGKLRNLVRLSARSATGNGSSCASASDDSAGAFSVKLASLWLAAAERALADNSSTLAIMDLGDVLSPGGVLEALRSRGYEVMDPP